MTNEPTPRIWLTTDTHFNHAKLKEWGRPDDYEEKTLAAIAREMTSLDTLIHLGDLAIGNDAYAIARLRDAARGRPIILVRGNHDKKSTAWYLRHGLAMVCDELVVKVNGMTVLLTHIPQPRRAGIDHNVHGHTHGNTHRDKDVEGIYEIGYHVELALEKSNYQPWRLDTLLRP